MSVVSTIEIQGTSTQSMDFAADGEMLIVATPEGVETYDLSEPANPSFAGLVEGVGVSFGDAEVSGNLLLTVSRDEGLKVSALDVVPLVQTAPGLLVTDDFGKLLHPGRFLSSVIPAGFDTRTAELELIAGPNIFLTAPMGFSGGRGELAFDKGFQLPFFPAGATPTPDPDADPGLQANEGLGPHMRVVLNRGQTQEKRTAILPVNVKPLLFGVSPRVKLALEVDAVNGTACLRFAQPIVYGLGLPARVTISLTVDGTERVLFSAVQDPSVVDPKTGAVTGIFQFFIEDLTLVPAISAVHPFRITAELPADPSSRMEVMGELFVDADTHGVLPVGHTFVKGVDLLNGHLVASSTDVRVAGRIPLELTRTYSSGGLSDSGAMGAGWTHNYLSRLIAVECFITIVGGDGTGQRFVQVGDRFVAQKGYHTRLEKNLDGSFDFYTKGGIRYHYLPLTDAEAALRGHRLDFIEEPNGNRLRMFYDAERRLTKVSEEFGSNFERSLTFEYTAEPVVFEFRVARVRGPLGWVVEYTYDELGNLTSVTRAPGTPDETVERYEYSVNVTEHQDRHNMTARTDANGNRTEYVYFTDAESFVGETTTTPVVQKYEYVKEVREPEGVTTAFSYDVSEVDALRFTTRVTDARGFVARYTMNANGSPLEIEEPQVAGATILTTMEWSVNDIFKTREVDANERETLFDYDERGNLIRETIKAEDVVTKFEYDATFNKMTLKRDAENRETRFEIDPANGNLLSVTDTLLNVTRFEYLGNGDLARTDGPRPGQSTRFTYDRFGNPGTTTDALGNVTTTVYDERSRLVSSSDTFGRSMTQEYDELDRVKLVRRTDVKGSSDEAVVTRMYFPGGQLKTETNALGLTTTLFLDGLNRLKRTEQALASGTLVSLMSYDESSNVIETTDRRGVKTINTYDPLNRLEQVEVAGPFGARQTVATMGYDLVGNKLFATDLQRNRTDFAYDGLYRVTARTLPTTNLPTIVHKETFGYDKVGNKLSETDANGNPTTFVYDALNRLTKRTDAVGNVVDFVYDEAGNQTLVHDVTQGLRSETDYDLLNRTVERRAIGSNPNAFTYVTTIAWDDVAHTMEETDPRGFRTTTELDGFDRVHRVLQETGEEVLETSNFYDANGNVRKSQDAEGRETDFIYDELNRLTQIDHPLTLMTSFDYDGEGNKTEEANRRGVSTRFAYDNLGRLTRMELDENITGGGLALVTSQITYDDPTRTRTEVDARGNSTLFEMDEQSRVVKITDADLKEQVFEYDGVNKTAEVDKRLNRTAFAYDGLNRLTKVTDARLQEIVTVYDDALRRVTETDKRNLVRTTELDSLGRLISVTRSGVLLEQHEYDGNNNRVLSTDANMNQTQFSYDGANRLIVRTDGLGSDEETATTFKYDRIGNLLEEKDGRLTGRPFDIKNTYDDLNRLTAVEDGEANITSFEYDGEGNRTAQVEPKGPSYRTEFDYGELNELIEVRMPDGGVYGYEYDDNRNRTTQTDAEGNVVTFTYDVLNRVDLMIQDPEGFALITNHDYDANGNETKLTDPKGQLIDFEYDELNRLKKKAYNLTTEDFALFTRTHEIKFFYDPNDNLERIDELKSTGTDAPAVESSFKTYDTLDRLESETNVFARTLTYDYDAQGNRTLLIDPDGKRTAYSYDELNRLETMTLEDGTPGAQVVTYDYFPNGLKNTVTNPNATMSTFEYDRAARMTGISHTGPFGVVSSYLYDYDANGNRTQQIETNAGRTEETTYDHDTANRLSMVTYALGTAEATQVAYTYDRVGNRKTEREVGFSNLTVTKELTYEYDTINRLDAISDSSDPSQNVAYTYDSNGNTTQKTKNGTTTSFLYDIRNQLGEVRQDSSILGRYGYDSEGMRILKIGDDGRRHYTYDQRSVITEANEANATVSKYDYGLDQLVSLDNTTEGRSFFHLDILRSTASLTDDVGGTRQSIFYDAWGNERDRVGSSANNFTFTGHEKDEETGLIYAKARFYDPDVGRFLSQDTVLGDVGNPPSLHRYSYVMQKPFRFVDPTGNLPENVSFLGEDVKELVETVISDSWSFPDLRP